MSVAVGGWVGFSLVFGVWGASKLGSWWVVWVGALVGWLWCAGRALAGLWASERGADALVSVRDLGGPGPGLVDVEV